MIAIETADATVAAGWHAILDLAEDDPSSWTLIGAHMVLLHGREHGREPPRASRDFDVLVNVRLVPAGTERVTRRLLEVGFELADPAPDGIAHRLRRGRAVIDVLAPDGVGSKTSLTTLPPARTVQVPGGTQALKRSEPVDVSVEGRTGVVPRPNLLGALLVKARAVDVDDVPEAQRRDLAFLLSLVPDPRALAADLSGAERRWLKRRAAMVDEMAPWLGLPNPDDARLALEILAGT
jgi:hypothetical protein